jgi:hypothetical protein
MLKTKKRTSIFCVIACILLFSVLFSNVSVQAATWNIHTVEEYGTGGTIAIDSKGNPHISFYNSTYFGHGHWINQLFYDSWDGSRWSRKLVDSDDIVFGFSSDSFARLFWIQKITLTLFIQS